MEEKLETKMKVYLPYIIIIGIVFLIVPALLLINSTAMSYIVLIGILPLTALLCCAHYSMNKNSDFVMSLIAPAFFLPAMFLYGIAQADALRAIIYLIAYFLCGYLGLTIGDILANRKGGSQSGDRRAVEPKSAERRPSSQRNSVQKSGVQRSGEVPDAYRQPARKPIYTDEEEPVAAARIPAAPPRARRVAVDAEPAPELFEAVDPYDDSSLDTSTTGDDIDAILREIHQRHGNE